MFTTSAGALRAIDELAVRGIADEQLSVLVCRGLSRLTAWELPEPSAGPAAGRLAGAVMAALFAASELCSVEIDAIGAGPLLRALGRIDREAILGLRLAERLALLGFDVATAESIDAGFCSGDILLGVDTEDEQLSVVAAQTFARIGVRSGVAALALSPG